MMSPVFSYKWQLYLFISFIGLLAVSPFLNKPEWFDRRVLYRNFKLYPRANSYTIDDALTAGNIDILFLGSSMTSHSNDLYTIKHAFIARYGYSPVIHKIYHAYGGFDIDYVMLKDILHRNHVKSLVFETPHTFINRKSTRILMPFLWDFSEHTALFDVPWVSKKKVYLYSTLNNFKLLVSPFILEQSHDNSSSTRCAYTQSYSDCLSKRVKSNQTKLDVIITPSIDHVLNYSRSIPEPYFTMSKRYSKSDLLILDKIVRLAKSHNIPILFATYPVLKHKRTPLPVIPKGHVAHGIPTICVSPEYLFENVAAKMFFVDGQQYHMNALGSYLHTKAMLPALFSVFDSVYAQGLSSDTSPTDMTQNIDDSMPVSTEK